MSLSCPYLFSDKIKNCDFINVVIYSGFFLYSVYFDLFLVPNVLMGDNGVTELFTVETPQFFGAIFEVNEPKFAKTIKSAP